MGYKRAIVLGNGVSRKDVDIPNDCDVWGCNYTYRENITIDYLVSTDVDTQHEIYRDGYPLSHECYFLGWYPMDSDDVLPGTFASTGVLINENEYTENGLVVSGSNNIVYFTYVANKDMVEAVNEIDLPMEFSSGSLAMYLASKSGKYDEILLAGFGDDEHAYEENNVPNKEVWKKEREFVIRYFSDIKWRYI